MDKKLFSQALLKFFLGLVIVGALVFIPAGTLRYVRGVVFMAILFLPMFAAGLVMMFKAPDLLRKRLGAKEEQSDQKTVVAVSGAMFIAGFAAAGLGFRFGWLMFPVWVSVLGAVLFLLSYIMYAEVMRENAYLSRTIEVQEGQKVVDTGLYGVVRHPMYTSTIVLFLSIPLVLGSPFALIIFLTYPILILTRIKGEERVLEEGLEGYTEYKKKVKYRLIPFIY